MPEIIEKDKLLMRVHVGEAKDEENGIEYHLSTSLATSTPMVSSSKTGRIFTISWGDILEMAIQAGINEEPDGT